MENQRDTLEQMTMQLQECKAEIHRLKKREENLIQERLQEEKLEFAWAGNLGNWEMDYITREVFANHMKLEALEYEPGKDSFKIEDFVAMIHPEDRDRANKDMRDHLCSNKPVYETEYRILTRTGKIKWFYDRGKIIEWTAEGEPHRIRGIVFDITERKMAEQQLYESEQALKKSNRIMNRMMRIMAHDLKNSLGNVVNLFEMMMDMPEDFDPEEKDMIFKELHGASKNSYVLLENILEWAKVHQGNVSIDPVQFKLLPVLKEVTELFQTQASQKKIFLKIDGDLTPDIKIECDYNVLKTILRNFVNNAIKYTKPEGTVLLFAKKQEEETVIGVRDTGVGMTDEQVTKIKTDRVDSQKGTADEKGTGMGLLISRELIEQIGAELVVQSKVGEGTTMAVRFRNKEG